MITAKRIFWLVAVVAAVSFMIVALRQTEVPSVVPPGPAPARGGAVKVVVPVETAEIPAPVPATETPVGPAPDPTAAAIPRKPRLPLPPGVAPIRNEKTLDFSSGRPVVRNEAADKAALEAGLREIEEATADLRPASQTGPTPAK